MAPNAAKGGIELIGAIDAAQNISSSQVRRFSWQDVAKHNTEQDCWMIIEGKVYNITEWLERHPGGKQILLVSAGRDCTDGFISYHPFALTKARQALAKYEIGVLDGPSEFPRYKPDSGFYAKCCERVGEYFHENKLDPKARWAAVWRMALVFVAAMATYVAANVRLGLPLWARVLAAAAFGVCQALPLLHIMHDSSHSAWGHTEGGWQAAGRFFMDFFSGANFTSWLYQHTIGHHIYTNVFEIDPDLPAAVEGDARRLVPKQAYSWVYRFQHLYLPPLYGILGIKFRLQDFTCTFYGQNNGAVRVNPIGFMGYAELWASKACYVAWRVALPLLVLRTPNFWLLWLVAELATGYWLAFNFQVSHVSTECAHYNGGHTTVEQEEWALSQVKGSVDYSHGGKLMTFLCGALNYQVTHHLFPTVSQYHYPAIAPIIMQVCEEYKVRYPLLPDFRAAFGAHIRHLYEMGQRGEAAEVHVG
ncbi:unnamed protein product [Heterosigma akashiwo]|mmetsp:Transcript_13357/g.20879  ORF Transcript_13357/g.20879 Transcript_13357/m.20879 type:complete len:476 (-) Transcript_13357:351-1778(-)